MSKLEIFEPAMCCETGLCGVGIDPELLRISTVVNTLKENGVDVFRANLSSNPKAFIDNKLVNEYLNKLGADNLPFILVDDLVVKTGSYPSNEEIVSWLNLDDGILETKEKETSACCTPEEIASGSCCSTEEIESGSCCSPEEIESGSCCSTEEVSSCCSTEESQSSSCCSTETTSSCCSTDSGSTCC